MAIVVDKSIARSKCTYDDALDCTGFGKYNILMLTSCCLLILAMYLDIFGLSVVLPAIACDMGLTTMQQGLISAAPLIGVMTSSYLWGLCADTQGRRRTLLIAMPIGVALNLVTSLAPTYAALVALKFLSASFTSSANAAGFVLAGESFPKRHRHRAMFLMASATMFVQLVACVCALPIFQLTFRITLSESLVFRPWRLLLLANSLPGIFGIVMMVFLLESPKYLLSKDHIEDCTEALRTIYYRNSGQKKESFPVQAVYLEDSLIPSEVSTSVLSKIWNQTAPLFKPPLLKNSLKLYFILLCAYMTSTGFTMWLPTTTNAYFNGEDATGKTFCEVASTPTATSNNSTSTDCDNLIQTSTLYAVMCYSGGGGILTVILSFLVGFTGKRLMTSVVMVTSAGCGLALLFTTVPLLSIALFCSFLFVALILGNINTYLVELNPTHLRGMATCLSVVVARGFGFVSVQLIAALLADYCVPMVSGYIVLVMSGFVVSLFLPAEEGKSKEPSRKSTPESIEASHEKTRF